MDNWFPVHDWTLDQVWTRIRQAGPRHHWAYNIGMPRLSCRFCIFTPKTALVLAGKHNLELLDKYVAVEQEVNHMFRKNLSLAEVHAAVLAGEGELVMASDMDDCWNMYN
ncbi:MAG TPA: hypothetical protein PLV53_08830 [Anaerolineaceae bacterium]|nr:hypothetical protein [Anaerolineaceae bacterium]